MKRGINAFLTPQPQHDQEASDNDSAQSEASTIPYDDITHVHTIHTNHNVTAGHSTQYYQIGDQCTDQATQSGTLTPMSPTNELEQQRALQEIEQQYDFQVRLGLLELNHNLRL